MNKKELREFYLNSYYKELDTREHLNSRLQFPLVIIIALIGVISYLTPESKPDYCIYEFVVLLIIYLATLISLAKAIIHFVKSYYNKKYELMSYLDKFDNYGKDLLDYSSENGDNDKGVTSEFIEYIEKEIIDCTSINSQTNDFRNNQIHFTNKWLIITSILLFILTVSYYILIKYNLI